MKIKLLLFAFFYCLVVQAQLVRQNSQLAPRPSSCMAVDESQQEHCFTNFVQDFIYTHMELPAEAKKPEFKGSITVLFEVNESGNFTVLYIDSPSVALETATRTCFAQFPEVSPASYNGRPTFAKYTLKIAIPLKSSADLAADAQKLADAAAKNYYQNRNNELQEYEKISYANYSNPEFKSQLSIPFSHSFYAHFDAALNQLGANNHTAIKPFTYAAVNKYFSIENENKQLLIAKKGWWGRKLFNENMAAIQGENYWFSVNPIVDFQLGKSASKISNATFINTRGIQLQGGLGRQLNFSTTIFESQGRFADYFNRYAESIAPAGGDPAVIPGIGIAKPFKTAAYDMPLAEATITYTPADFFMMQSGYGRNFVGDGYRSLITTDGVSPYPYFKLNTKFWKIQYTNTYMFLKDVRPEVTLERTYATKYLANHYLSWNASKRLNIGFFESVIWANTNGRGFDMSFFNPIIFYRSVEFASSARTGNALLGLTGKYKLNNQFNVYGQFLLDEFSLEDIKAGDNSWKNKYGYQVGFKYFNAFNIEHLLLQVEYNHVRPYVYSHSDPLTNYGHTNQSLGHQWGGNFKECIFIARYYKRRFFADGKLTYGLRGLDFNTADNTLNYGSNIYRDYDEQRAANTGVVIGQGNKTTVLIADFQAGYLVNPATNLKLFGSFIYRNFNPLVDTPLHFKERTTWFSVGLRADIFNWYFDY
ncbi:MAG: hypothetical protein RIT03_1508 [Bacteroidota bacterium]|jgi:hypothetical protein